MSWQIVGLSLDEIQWNSFQLGFKEGASGGGCVCVGGLNTATPQKKVNEHRITAREVHETPSPQQLFLAT